MCARAKDGRFVKDLLMSSYLRLVGWLVDTFFERYSTEDSGGMGEGHSLIHCGLFHDVPADQSTRETETKDLHEFIT
jgi:hypothetical protein